jgi:hypothetical protein
MELQLGKQQKEEVARICDRILAGNIEGAIIMYASKEDKGERIEGFMVGEGRTVYGILQALEDRKTEVENHLALGMALAHIFKDNGKKEG